MFMGLRRPFVPEGRLGLALLASALLHSLTLLTLSNYAVRGGVFTRPIFAPLSVRIEHLPAPPAAKPMAINRSKAALHLKASSSVADPVTPPREIETVLPEPGVSFSEILYLRPIPGRVSSPLLKSGEFRRSSEVSEKPEILRMRMPKYPQPVREQKIAGWVTVLLFVDEDGKVVDTAPIEASEVFSDYEKEIAAGLRDSAFTPGKLDGRPVKTQVFITVRFDPRAISGTDEPTPPEPKEVHDKR
jgi:TonB family protein